MARINLEALRQEEAARNKTYVWDKPLIINKKVIKRHRKSTLCPVCKKPIDKRVNFALMWDVYADIIVIADYGGVEALTEHEQMLYHSLVHVECFEKLQ